MKCLAPGKVSGNIHSRGFCRVNTPSLLALPGFPDIWVGKIPWSRKWHPTPLLLPGKSLRQKPGRPQSIGSRSRVGHNWAIKPKKAMAPHSSTLAWKIPWTEEPGRLQSMGYRRVRQDWATSLSLFTFMHWKRKWQPTPVSLPGESQGWRSLVGWRLWGCTESDTTEVT